MFSGIKETITDIEKPINCTPICLFFTRFLMAGAFLGLETEDA